MTHSNRPPHESLQRIYQARDFLKSRIQETPQIALILGSGLGPVAEAIEESVTIHYNEIPNFHKTSVIGHAGKMSFGTLKGVPVVCLQGRFHLYEGHDLEDVVLPTRVVCSLGVHTVLQTNAAGGVNTRFRPADLMLIEDHLNLMGTNPLRGPNISELGPRFPDMTRAYHPDILKCFQGAAKEAGIAVQQGIYAGLLGPTFETPAEIRMFRTLGADAVGMSTVPETIAANHMGVRVGAISCITNLGAGLSPNDLTHDEVIEISKIGSEKLKQLLFHAVPKLAGPKK